MFNCYIFILVHSEMGMFVHNTKHRRHFVIYKRHFHYKFEFEGFGLDVFGPRGFTFDMIVGVAGDDEIIYNKWE